jgi:hypothetical protein
MLLLPMYSFSKRKGKQSQKLILIKQTEKFVDVGL